MYRDKVLLRRKFTPRWTFFCNGHSFVARYEGKLKKLPSNVTIRRNRTIGPR